MPIEMHDGKITGSSGIAKAGLTLGIIGTGLAVLENGGFGNGLFGTGKKASELEAQLAELKAMRYTDGIGIDLYKNIVATANAEDAKIAAVQTQLYDWIIKLDKETALNKQATEYQFTILNNKLDCCCDKAGMQMAYNKQLSELADARIISYVNSNFLPGNLYLPSSSITPPVVTA